MSDLYSEPSEVDIPDFDSMSEDELELFTAFLNQTDDPYEAAQNYNDYIEQHGHQAAATHGDEPDTSMLSEAELTIYETFRAHAPDAATAIGQFQAYMSKAAATHGEPSEADSEAAVTAAVEDFFETHPDVDPGNDEFWAMANAAHEAGADDALEAGYQMYKRGQQVIGSERAKMGGKGSQQYNDFDHAFAAARAAGEIGGGAEKVTARRPDSMADAMDSWGEELHAENQLKKAARERIEADRMIRQQETRGRS